MQIVTDPLTWIGGAVGAGSKMGKASKADDLLKGTKEIAEKSVDDIVQKGAKVTTEAAEIEIKSASRELDNALKEGDNAVNGMLDAEKAAKGGSTADDFIEGGRYSSFRDLMSPEEAIRYNKYWNKKITSIPKGSRSDPVTYLSETYIDKHLSQFDDGISIIQTDWAYSRYSETNGFVGVPDDNTLFVMPKSLCDNVIKRANGDLSIIEKELGFTDGYFSDGGGLVRINVDDISELNIRMPSGNETGANKLWIPGGYTSGGVPEAISDTIPLSKANIITIDVN